jgi:hypothetical protein
MLGMMRIKMRNLLREGNMKTEHMYRSCIAIVFIIFAGSAFMSGIEYSEAVDAGSQPIEIGLVNWGRNFEEAFERSPCARPVPGGARLLGHTAVR